MFEDMPEAPTRERAALARSVITMNMEGPKKSAKFGLLLKGTFINVSVVFDTLSKYARLIVGKYFVSAKQRSSNDPLFPLAVALSDLYPLSKVWVNYKPYPNNIFQIKVNDEDIYSLVKEEVDYDPAKTEKLLVELNFNDKKDKNDNLDCAISGAIPWIIEEVEEKISTALGIDNLCILNINKL